ncbi:hypothetical protein [Streptomyces purpureus]|uniref:L-tyrosine 3-hydroxylase n=1 Tax=Streptomyces purpureus TaxID=1951 RepID=A0A918H1D5_9ACTN|nr:hypothetical protein [Streptomyces purpureus]GGT29160.1 hypothetical protein GCM10014713_23370 [Streptomyces purpureus]
MSVGAARTVSELPAPDGWDFGDFPYGLEPLTLPEPPVPGTDDGVPDVLPGGAAVAAAQPACARTGPGPASAELAHQLYWFRWITGHQVTFAVWQLLAHALHQARSRPDPADSLTAMAELTRSYTAMLLYTSSCPKDVYAAVIRPSMYLQHRGFSGTWAPDFAPVRGLLRGKKFAWNDTPEGQALGREVRMYHAVHSGVAAKLVPDGRSLLQETAAHPSRPQHPGMQALVYDNYFLTLRGPVTTADLVDQLRRRLRAVRLDVAANGLYPGLTPEEDAELPEELRTDDVRTCEREFHGILRRTDVSAAGLTPRLLDGTAR